LEYFGEEHDRCGHCGGCEGVAARPLPPADYPPLGVAEAERIRSLRREGHASLSSARQLTRFLCGLTSPATTRAKLRTHRMFGALKSTPFREVLSFVDRLV
jgi:ATP-dependent DNA helicase RecQ